jgi:hypothetical protein
LPQDSKIKKKHTPNDCHMVSQNLLFNTAMVESVYIINKYLLKTFLKWIICHLLLEEYVPILVMIICIKNGTNCQIITIIVWLIGGSMVWPLLPMGQGLLTKSWFWKKPVVMPSGRIHNTSFLLILTNGPAKQ